MADDAVKQDALFVNIVLVFKSAAMQQMGKIMNPISGEIEKNLDQARFSIDTLEMLKAKTRGNLSDELDRLLDSTLMELRMNYVEEAEAGQAGEAPGEPKQDTGAGAPAREPGEATGRSQPDGGAQVTAAGGTPGGKARGGKRPGKGKAGKSKRGGPKRPKRT